MTIRIDQLDSTVNPGRDHEFPAMRDGISNKLRADQILALLQTGDIPDEAVTLAKLAADARAASGHTFDDTIAQLGETDVQGAIDVLAMGYRLRGAPIKIEESGTYTPSSTDVRGVYVIGQAAGGGGGGAGGTSSGQSSAGQGGWSGARFERFIPISDASTYSATLTIGAEGQGGTGSANGGDGGDTVFDDGALTLTAEGGPGGAGSSAISGLAPNIINQQLPIASGGQINIPGRTGDVGYRFGGGSGLGGKGGDSLIGAGGRYRRAAGTNNEGGDNAVGYGAGGGGAAANDTAGGRSGGNGTQGVMYAWEFV